MFIGIVLITLVMVVVTTRIIVSNVAIIRPGAILIMMLHLGGVVAWMLGARLLWSIVLLLLLELIEDAVYTISILALFKNQTRRMGLSSRVVCILA